MKVTAPLFRRLRAAWMCILFAAMGAAPLLSAESTPREVVRAQAPDDPVRSKQPTHTLEFKPAELNLVPGERLEYEIKVGGVPAGKSLMEVVREETWANGASVWNVLHFTRSNRAVSLFYGVQDKHTSIIDKKSGFSRFFRLQLHEGDVKIDEKISMNYDIGEMKATFERLRADGRMREYTLPLLDKVLDPLSAIYYLRSVDFSKLKEGESFALPICTDRRVLNTPILVGGMMTLDAGPLKGRRARLLKPQVVFRGLFERRGNMELWVDEQTGIPLRMTCEIPIGFAEITLESFSKESPFGPKQ